MIKEIQYDTFSIQESGVLNGLNSDGRIKLQKILESENVVDEIAKLIIPDLERPDDMKLDDTIYGYVEMHIEKQCFMCKKIDIPSVMRNNNIDDYVARKCTEHTRMILRNLRAKKSKSSVKK